MEGISEVTVHAAEAHLVVESLKIMVVGMLTVFIFLWLLILILNVQGRFLTRFFPQKTVAETGAASTAAPAKPGNDNLAAVIMAAVNLHRKRKREK